jgi:L-threonylcarbamoyladenylate synthase
MYAPGRVLDALSEFPDIKSRVAVAVWDSDSSLGEDGHPSVHFEEVMVSTFVHYWGKYFTFQNQLN